MSREQVWNRCSCCVFLSWEPDTALQTGSARCGHLCSTGSGSREVPVPQSIIPELLLGKPSADTAERRLVKTGGQESEVTTSPDAF